MPFYGLAFLWIYRLIHLKPYLMGFTVWIFILPGIMDDKADAFWNAYYGLMLLTSLCLIGFYWKEIQHQFTQQDRLSSAQQPGRHSIFQVQDMNVTPDQTPLTWFGNTLDAVIMMGFAIWMGTSLFKALQQSPPAISIESLLARPWLCFVVLFVPYWMFILIRDLYQRSVASGFAPGEAVWMTLMQVTIVLGPLAQALGVKKGVVARCDQCRHHKFIWAQHCPHCGFLGPGTVQNKKVALLAQGRPMGITIRQRLAKRLLIPFQCLFICGFLGMGSNRPFIIHPVHLSFTDAQTAREAAISIQNWIENHTDADTWLSSVEHPVQPPKQYRLNVRYQEGENYMSVWAYSLRWDKATGLSEILAEDLKHVLPETQKFTAAHTKEMPTTCPLGQLSTFLDNGIHWEKSPSHRHK